MHDVFTIAGVHPRAHAYRAASTDAILLALSQEFSQASAAALVAAIEDDSRLLFFDAEHPQRSDPGLFVSLQRRDGALFVKGANHGWSYPWVPIAEPDAVRWLWLCRYANADDGTQESSVLRMDAGHPFVVDEDHETRARFTDWLRSRLEG